MLILLALLAPTFAQDPTHTPLDDFKPAPTWKALGRDLWFDPAARRLIVRARVAVRDNALEHLLCSRGSKDHESTLITDAPPRQIQAGLLLTGAEVGHPVLFEPKFAPPAGTPIAIELEWTEAAGKTHKADARTWIKDLKTGVTLQTDWVFAGSQLLDDPRTKVPFFAADDGDLITVANFPSSILDLPFRSSANDTDRTFVSNSAVMPERGTPVTIYLQPRKLAVPAKP